MRIRIDTKRWVFDLETGKRPEEPHEPQPRGDVYASTERAYVDEPTEMRIGFHGPRTPR